MDRIDTLEETVGRLYQLFVEAVSDLEVLTSETATPDEKAKSRSRVLDVIRAYHQMEESEGFDAESQLSFAFVRDEKRYLS